MYFASFPQWITAVRGTTTRRNVPEPVIELCGFPKALKSSFIRSVPFQVRPWGPDQRIVSDSFKIFPSLMTTDTECRRVRSVIGLPRTAIISTYFAEMLRRGGTLDDARIFGPKSIAFMTQNHLSESSMHAAWEQMPTPDIGRRGFGFVLGFGVVTDAAAIGVLGSDGEYNWGGAAGTIF